MNREQARNYLKSSGMSEEQITAVESAFTCEDAISRQAAIDAMSEETCGCCWDAKYILKHLPSVSTAKTGRWITKIKSDLRGDMWPTNPKCSECGGEPYYSNTIYN